jgi:DNA-binding NarL/FixJ family response regulator
MTGLSLPVVLADRHPLAREAVSALIAAEDFALLVAAVPDLRSAGEHLRRHRSPALVVDADLWQDEQRDLGPRSSDVALVLLGLHDQRAYADAALRAGAAAYVVKDDAHARLSAVLRRLATGG